MKVQHLSTLTVAVVGSITLLHNFETPPPPTTKKAVAIIEVSCPQKRKNLAYLAGEHVVGSDRGIRVEAILV